ncbi:MAG: histidine kinase dimerization/phosphoacceptor domain -containing protein [Pseudomonadota bacterium]
MTDATARETTQRTGFRSARLRLALLLTLAVLPLGVIALVEARNGAATTREMSQRALLGEAIRVAAAQRAMIRTAQGQARAVVPLLRAAPQGDAGCAALMEQVAKAADNVEFVGFAQTNGHLSCTSDGHVYETAGHAALLAGAENAAVVSGSALAPLPGTLLVLQPVYRLIPAESGVASQSVRIGTVLLGLSQNALLTVDAIPGEEPAALDIATLNRAGEVLWSSPDLPGAVVGPAEDAAASRLPADADYAALADAPAHALTATTGSGETRTFAAVPVVEGEVVTLASWQPGSLFDAQVGPSQTLGVVLPLLMWVLSLLVAYFTVNRLLLRPLGALQGRMQAFTAGDRMLPPFRLEGAPDELTDLADTFDTMTSRIVSDETRLERAVHEQEVLLKEVHHRVKNNLQLIASILNMQIRQHRSPENRAILRRVQDRVMSLATVHQHLYQTPALSTLRADTLLAEIVNRKLGEIDGIGGEIEVTTDFAPIRLYPDQAVPLALLVGEAVTNVFHHIGRPANGARPWMRITLSEEANGQVRMQIENSSGEKLAATQSEYRAGLGTRLIEAFAQQLEGTLDRRESDDEGWVLSLTFELQSFQSALNPGEGPLEPPELGAARSQGA